MIVLRMVGGEELNYEMKIKLWDIFHYYRNIPNNAIYTKYVLPDNHIINKTVTYCLFY